MDEDWDRRFIAMRRLIGRTPGEDGDGLDYDKEPAGKQPLTDTGAGRSGGTVRAGVRDESRDFGGSVGV
ncbi:hypothetical protein [Phytoactinopolyspora halotolerans]|uniref:Uncharacterized protein n=1 Tax=Phytoactinopolyspora halotolerans TaxID=1981512 RepID=A0A6L9SHP3_9ACTN|nr:hypothetical protein [Phytoactinopolyspora halotolerans]NEE04168.1 hypothetical protein [Phytoactinopolyspora halotolerans]